jgi:hypothetical protein
MLKKYRIIGGCNIIILYRKRINNRQRAELKIKHCSQEGANHSAYPIFLFCFFIELFLGAQKYFRLPLKITLRTAELKTYLIPYIP